tara:strand:- start:713 stop:1516 length:804 start_codon:yes stop_codon:yes gene_type:complete
MSSTWARLATRNSYEPLFAGPECLVVTATDNACVIGVVGMIKSFLLNAGLSVRFIVLGRSLSERNKEIISALPLTQIVSIDDPSDRHAPDHWCSWILELFWLEHVGLYNYVFYVDADIMVRRSLSDFIQEFKNRNISNVCVIDHKNVWHKNWFDKKRDHNFNAGFIIFDRSFFGSEEHERLKNNIERAQPRNDERYLRQFFSGRNLLYAPTKFNGRIIWLKKCPKEDDVFVVHFVGQENKPWLFLNKPKRKIGRWHKEWIDIYKEAL